MTMTVARARRRYQHGTSARYHLGRCRCDRCFRANKRYAKKLRDNPQMHLVSAQPVAAHIRFLQSQGMGIQTIAELAGVTSSVTARFVDRYRHIRRTRPATAAKILAVTPQPKGGIYVRADETLVLFERLKSAGYAKGWIARQLGNAHGSLNFGRTGWVRIATARKTLALYRRLSRRNPSLPPIDGELRMGQVKPRGRWKGEKPDSIGAAVAAKLYPHGTRSRFLHAGCRCKRCVKANTEFEALRQKTDRLPYAIRRTAARSWNVVQLENSTVVARANSRRKALQLRDGLNSADPLFSPRVLLDATPVRLHLIALHDAGVAITAVAAAAGVTPSAISYLRLGKLKRVKRATAQRILAVDTHVASANVLVDANGVRKLLDRLDAVGFSRSWVAQLLGLSPASLRSLGKTIRYWRARAIMTLYAHLRERIALLRALDERRATRTIAA